MSRRLGLVAALALLVACTAAAAVPRVQVNRPPAGIRVGDVWRAAVSVSGARPRAFLVARDGRIRSLRLRPAGTRYRATVVFPSAGQWRYGVRFVKRDRFLGRVLVRPARPRLQQPFGLVVEAAGTVLVADWRGDAVYRLHLDRREGRRLARVPAPRDLVRGPQGTLLVASANQILELDAVTGASRPLVDVGAFVGGIAPDVDGTLNVNVDATTVIRIAPDGVRTTLATGLDGVHGLLPTPGGLIVCESYAGRVLRLRGGRLEVVASGLANPSYAAPAPDGGLYVTEFLGSRVSHVSPDGRTRTVADVPQPGPITVDSSGRLLVGTLSGSIYRIVPGSGRAQRVYP